jgi:anti-sigma regulatory factor (Ser/Thr protein kinase)
MPRMDEIVLTIPRERPYYGVAHLVLGGLASRLGVTLEHLEDIQLGLDSLLAQHGNEDVTLHIRIADGSIETEVGPFPSELSTALEDHGSNGVGLRRILDAVADDVRLGERDGGTWVTLSKRVDGAGG